MWRSVRGGLTRSLGYLPWASSTRTPVPLVWINKGRCPVLSLLCFIPSINALIPSSESALAQLMTISCSLAKSISWSALDKSPITAFKVVPEGVESELSASAFFSFRTIAVIVDGGVEDARIV